MIATLAKLARRLNSRSRLPPLILMTDAQRLPDPLPVAARLPPGCAVLLRHYEVVDRLELGRRMARLCRRRRLLLLVAGDVGLAAALRADGLHLPEGLARSGAIAARLWTRKRGGLLTVAAHSRAALRRAAIQGADAALLSPVFPTASHPGAATLGARRFTRLTRSAGLPVYALGGVTAKRLAALRHSGAAGVATVGR